MRRTDEAFKKEIYRRYYVEKRNRRNLRIYAVTSLLLCVLAIGVAVPMVAGTSLPEKVASLFNRQPQSNPEPNQLSEYLSESVTSLHIMNQSTGAFHDCTEAEGKETVGVLVKLPLTELSSEPDHDSLLYKLRILTPTHEAQLYLDPTGYIRLDCIRWETVVPETVWYQIPAEEMATLIEYIEMLVSSSTTHVQEQHDALLSDTLETYLDKTITKIQVSKDGGSAEVVSDAQQIERFKNQLRSLEYANCEDYSRSLAKSYYNFDLTLADGTAMGINIDSTGYIQLMPYHINCAMGSHLYEYIISTQQAAELIRYAADWLNPGETLPN